MVKESKASPKTDAMRKQREERIKAAEARVVSRPIDNRVNEASTDDPNGRGGKSKIKVPKKDGKVKVRRDETPVPEAGKAPAPGGVGKRVPIKKDTDVRVKCHKCGRKIQAINGKPRNHLCAAD